PNFEYLLFNLVWFLLYVHYTSQMTLMIYMNAVYLYLICTIIRMKFRRLETYLASYAQLELELLDCQRTTQGHIANDHSKQKLYQRMFRSPMVDMTISNRY